MAKCDHTRNFCDNIKAYNERVAEEQFYNFTMKAKDSVQVIKSHNFILASQSEYFAGLFRRHPTASETTFTDFSLNVVKKCIDYLYRHELEQELTRENVHDIMIFADYINLTDVTDICINYMISNIDHSNWARVIEFGYSRGNMHQFIDAGILFFLRNYEELDIDDLDDSTLITEVLCLQEQQVTIMTSEQWDMNQVRHFMSVPKDERKGWQARSSSIHANNVQCWAPKLAINGKLSHEDSYYFHSQREMHPWLEVRFPSPVLVSSLTIINRINGSWERLRNVEVRAGMSPIPEGFTAKDRGYFGPKLLEVNSRCGYFAGPPAEFVAKGHEVEFNKPTLAQYITLQILELGALQINGIKINNGDLMNYDGSCKLKLPKDE